MTAENKLVLTTVEQLQELVMSAIDAQFKKHFAKEPFADYPDFLTKNEAATMCNVSVGTINNWITDRRLKPSRNGRVIRFEKSKIIALLQQNPKHKRV